MPENHVSQRNLPHWYQPGHAHFVTYRLADTIPVWRLVQWRHERAERIRRGDFAANSPRNHREIAHKQYFRRYDEHLDQNTAVRWLADDRVAEVVRENLHHHHEVKYQLLAYSVMPNHVHVLFQPYETVGQAASLPVETVGYRGAGTSLPEIEGGHSEASSFGHEGVCVSDELPDSESPLSRIMHSLKSYTANRANEILGRTGRFWQHESYDHWVRDGDELERIVDYIRMNPVRAGLCARPVDWRWSSAADRWAIDGSDCGLVGWLVDD